MSDLSRREFLGLTPLFLATPHLLERLVPATIHIAMVYSPGYANAAKAAAMSAHEASRTAQLLKRDFKFTLVTQDQFEVDETWNALIKATEGPFSVPREFVVVDITPGTRVCPTWIYHVNPRQPHAMWHHSLERFGAAQLNDRFHAAGVTIDDHAWAAWFAVKALWESLLVGKSLAELPFDGHKGRALHFNAFKVLEQPLYKLNGDKTAVVEEITIEHPAGGIIC